MKALKFVFWLVVTLLTIFFVGAWLLPGQVGLERSIRIERPPAQVFAVLEDLDRFNEWSPWYRHEPDAEYWRSGPERGPGAALNWRGERLGEGSMTIISQQPSEAIDTEVRFGGQPDPALANYRLQALDPDATQVTWTFSARMAWPTARWFGLLLPRYIGADYQDGLASLKTVVEAAPVDTFDDLVVSLEQISSRDIIALAGSAPRDDAEASAQALGEAYGQLLAIAQAQNLTITGQPITLTAVTDQDTWQFEAALPVRADGPVQVPAPARFGQTPSGTAAVVEHIGAYDRIAATLQRLEQWLAAHGHQRQGPIMQIYVSDPGDTPTEELVTRILVPISP